MSRKLGKKIEMRETRFGEGSRKGQVSGLPLQGESKWGCIVLYMNIHCTYDDHEIGKYNLVYTDYKQCGGHICDEGNHDSGLERTGIDYGS